MSPEAQRSPAISVITVVSGPGPLTETLASLQSQTLSAWEWVVMAANPADVPPDLAADQRVRLLTPSVGTMALTAAAAKLAAVEACTADTVVDLDVGDWLATPTALEVLAGGDGIRYGDVKIAATDAMPPQYDPRLGWEVVVDPDLGPGVVRAFEPTASALHRIDFAPAHGLAWPRQAYLDLGGPAVELGGEADWDLLCRAVTSGVRIARVPHCTVVSTRQAHRPSDAVLAQRLSNAHVYNLIAAWCQAQGLAMLDMGAAHNPAPGFTSVDLRGADINCDVLAGLPVPDGSVGCIRAYDFLEHMPRCPDSACTHGADGSSRCAVGVMNDFYRALAPGGWLVSFTPSSDGRGAFQDPTHVSFWNPNSFWYYTRRDQARFVPGITCRFQATRVWQDFPNDWHRTHNIPYVWADLVAIKGQRQPGIVEI